MAFSSLFTITFHRQGVSPPVYIAGEFSDPPWEPCELDYTLDNDGEYTFTYQLSVAPGQDYQYKFRCGMQQWLLDESKPTGRHLHDPGPSIAQSGLHTPKHRTRQHWQLEQCHPSLYARKSGGIQKTLQHTSEVGCTQVHSR